MLYGQQLCITVVLGTLKTIMVLIPAGQGLVVVKFDNKI